MDIHFKNSRTHSTNVMQKSQQDMVKKAAEYIENRMFRQDLVKEEDTENVDLENDIEKEADENTVEVALQKDTIEEANKDVVNNELQKDIVMVSNEGMDQENMNLQQ